jgi:hypothetical protein
VSADTIINEGTDRWGRVLDPAPEAERLETTPSEVHLVLMEPTKERLWAHEKGAGVPWHDQGRWTTDTVVVLPRRGGYGPRFGLGYLDDTATWNQGPHLPRKQGRDAFLFGLSSVIDNHGGTAAEMERLQARGLVVNAQLGDHLLILTGHAALGVMAEKTLWKITADHSGHPRLQLVQR